LIKGLGFSSDEIDQEFKDSSDRIMSVFPSTHLDEKIVR